MNSNHPPTNSRNPIARLRRRLPHWMLGIASCALVAFAAHAEDCILGYTEPYRIITVSAAETGVIAEVLVEEGDAVKKGQILAKLDTATLNAELEIAKAEAKLQATRKQRLDELAGANRAAPEEVEKARADFTIKEAQVRKIEAMIETRLMRSPVDGIVTEIKRDPSEAVSAANPHVLTVVQIDKLTANLFLPPAKALQLKVGGEVALLLDEHEKVPGKIEFVSPVTDAASGTVRVKFAIENAGSAHRSGARCALAE
jgi:RND family efflux transporter MFP subunit